MKKILEIWCLSGERNNKHDKITDIDNIIIIIIYNTVYTACGLVW